MKKEGMTQNKALISSKQDCTLDLENKRIKLDYEEIQLSDSSSDTELRVKSELKTPQPSRQNSREESPDMFDSQLFNHENC